MATSKMASTRWSVRDLSLLAQSVPNQAPVRLPARRPAIMFQCSRTCEKGTLPAQKGSNDATTTRLVAWLMITAGSAPNSKTLIRTGNRNRHRQAR